MGKLIDVDETMKNLAKANMSRVGNEFERFLLQQPPVEAIPKADYEAKLKAVLKELQKEVDELCINNPLSEDEEDMNRGIEKAADVIQQKINALMVGK